MVIPSIVARAIPPDRPGYDRAMLLARALQRAVDRTRAKPLPVRLAWTLALVGVLSGVRVALDPIWPAGYPYILSYGGIILAAALFRGPAGVLATGLSAAFAAFFYLQPLFSFQVSGWAQQLGLLVFVMSGAFSSTVIEAFHEALERAHRAEAGQALLLKEFRHRTRNDLASLSALLLLRARSAPPEAQAAIREGAAHCLALAKVHTRLSHAEPDGTDGTPVVNTREFVMGLVQDLGQGIAGDGLRPVSILADADAHHLSTERAVQLGLVINETVTNALKYAFPGERSGTIWVAFRREGERFLLTVEDDGVGLPPEAIIQLHAGSAARARSMGMGTRLLRSLAAQLRGHFQRHPGPEGVGCVCELTFPAEVWTAPPPG